MKKIGIAAIRRPLQKRIRFSIQKQLFELCLKVIFLHLSRPLFSDSINRISRLIKPTTFIDGFHFSGYGLITGTFLDQFYTKMNIDFGYSINLCDINYVTSKKKAIESKSHIPGPHLGEISYFRHFLWVRQPAYGD